MRKLGLCVILAIVLSGCEKEDIKTISYTLKCESCTIQLSDKLDPKPYYTVVDALTKSFNIPSDFTSFVRITSTQDLIPFTLITEIDGETIKTTNGYISSYNYFDETMKIK